jgi:hypothetical protein
MVMVAIGPTPGRDADQGADHAAEKAQPKILERQRNAQSQAKITEELANSGSQKAEHVHYRATSE